MGAAKRGGDEGELNMSDNFKADSSALERTWTFSEKTSPKGLLEKTLIVFNPR